VQWDWILPCLWPGDPLFCRYVGGPLSHTVAVDKQCSLNSDIASWTVLFGEHVKYVSCDDNVVHMQVVVGESGIQTLSKSVNVSNN
jgi:hypothetical protein